MTGVPRADLLITGGSLWTDGAFLRDADSLAIAGTRILAIGRRSPIEALAGPLTRRIEARGTTVTPGLWDAHLHLLPWARAHAELDLAGTTSALEVCARLRGHLETRPEAWAIVGRGWDADRWSAPPSRAALDAVSASRPVLLHSHDFHALWVNSAALAAAGISRSTPDPAGGVIERDAAGEPTGVVRENAVRAFRALEDEAARSAGDPARLLGHAAGALHALGVTAVHDFERGEAAFSTMEHFARGPGPRLRVLQCVGPEDLERVVALGLASGHGDDDFRVGSLKLFADGTLGSRTAALLEPYDGTSERGLDVLSAAGLAAEVRRGLASGFAVAVHAIGDRACRHALEAFASAGRSASAPAIANRIEHAQLVAEADLPRFAALGVAASMQPIHCTSDAELAERYWGSRRERSYPWRALIENGATLAFGSDAPVEPPSVAAGLHAACTRRSAQRPGSPAFAAGQCVSLDVALRAYTEGGARLAGAWPRLGSLREGSLADVVIWDRDLFGTALERLHEARPSCTVGNGAVLHEGAAATA